MTIIRDKTGKFLRNLKARNCIICNTIFQPRLDKQKYCLRKCYDVFLKSKLEKICQCCGKDFVGQSGRQKFCSPRCFGQYNMKDRKKENHSRWRGGMNTYKCLECGKSFESYNREMTPIYCSRKCYSLTQKGRMSPLKGTKHPQFSGENHPNWLKDRTKLKKFDDTNKDRRSSAYANWRREVWKRDNFKCRIDNKDCNGQLQAHHILGYTDYPELRYEINNGITLCLAHHPLKRAEEKRLSPFFQDLVSVSKTLF